MTAVPPAAPNVLFVVIDDASWEEFTNLQLPTIQYGSLLGRVYERFYTSPVCSPTRAQFHFGRYPHDNLIGKPVSLFNGKGVPTRDVSLAEVLGSHGYATGMFGKWHLNGEKLPLLLGEAPRLHGYQTWQAGSVGNVMATGGSHYNWERWDDGKLTVESTYTTHAIGDALTSWWSTTAGPKFAVCSFLAPHEPFEPAPADLVGGQTFAPTQRGRYESALVGIDTKILQLAATIDFSNTYVFLFPDNGTPHQVPPPTSMEQGYKRTPYEGGIHVPLVVWGPGVVPGSDLALIQAVDLPATVLELAGIPTPQGALEDSISFAQTLDGSQPGTRPWVWAQHFSPNEGPVLGGLTTDEWAIIRPDGLKLVRRQKGGSFGPHTLELYDLSGDPHETTPITDPATQASLQQLKKQALGPDWPY